MSEDVNSSLIQTTDDGARIATDPETGAVVSFYEKTGELVIKEYTASSFLLNASESKEAERAFMPFMARSASASEISNSSKKNEYRYSYSSVNSKYAFWTIQIPNQVKAAYATAGNVENLSMFRKNVDDLRKSEDGIFSSFASATANMIIAAIPAAATLKKQC